MTASTGMVAGSYHMQIARRSSAGYPMGQLATPDAPVAGTTYPAYKVPGYAEVTAPQATVEIAKRYAGQKIKGTRSLGISDFGEFQVTLADYDELFNAIIGGSTVDSTTLSGLDLSSPNMNNADVPQLIALFSMGIQIDNGTNMMLTYVYDNVQITRVLPGVTQSGGVNPNPLQFTVTCSTSLRTAMGRLYSITGLQVIDNSDIGIGYRHTNPLMLTTFIKNAVATSFIMPYRPTTTDATGAATNSITNNGVTEAVTSVSTTTGVVTLAAAGVSGHIVVALMPTIFTPI